MIGGSNIKEAFFNSDPDVFGYESVRIAELLLKSNADDDINVLRDWVFRSNDFSTKVKVE